MSSFRAVRHCIYNYTLLKTIRKCRFGALVLCFVLACASAFGATAKADFDRSFYGPLLKMPFEELVAKSEKYFEESKFDSSMAYSMVAINRYSDKMSKDEKLLCAEAMYHFGLLAFYYLHDYNLSLSYQTRTFKIADELGNERLRTLAITNIADVNTVYGDTARANKLLRQALKNSRKIELWGTYKAILIDFIAFAALRDDFNSISGELDDLAKNGFPDDEPLAGYLRHLYRSVSLYREGNYKDALAATDMAVEAIDEKLNAVACRLVSNMVASRILAKSGDYPDAIDRMKSSLSLPLPYHARRDVFRELSVFYGKTGNADSAQTYKVKYALMNDSSLSYGQYMSMRDSLQSYALTKMGEQVAQDVQRHSNSDALMFFFAAVAVAAVGFAVWSRWGGRRGKADDETAFGAVPPVASVPEGKADGSGMRVETPHEPDDKTKGLAAEIQRFMETSQEIFSQDFSLERLAAMLHVHTRSASRAINDVFGVNFNSLLSQYRIKEACRRLSSDEYSNVTIQAISFDCGFKSHSNFVSVFKKQTGVSPSEYKKKHAG